MIDERCVENDKIISRNSVHRCGEKIIIIIIIIESSIFSSKVFPSWKLRIVREGGVLLAPSNVFFSQAFVFRSTSIT